MRNGRTEERHDAVARVLVDRAFEAVHAFRQNLKKLLENAMPLFGAELFGEFHRALHICEENSDLLALAFERGLGLEDLVGQMFRCVVRGRSWR